MHKTSAPSNAVIESPTEWAIGSYQKPMNASLLPEMSRKVKGTYSRGEKRHEEKSGIQDVTASVGGYGECWIA